MASAADALRSGTLPVHTDPPSQCQACKDIQIPGRDK